MPIRQNKLQPADDLLRDMRYAWRSLRKTPAFAATAIVTLALGIGANTAIFSALEGELLAPLPYRDADRLVTIGLYNRSLKYDTYAAYPDFLDWQRDTRSFAQISAFSPLLGFDLTSPGEPEHVDGYQVSSGFFDTLGVKMALGRALSPNEDRLGGPAAAVISYRLWRDRFSGSPSALGKLITMNGIGYSIVGVLRPEFRLGDEQVDVYASLGRSDPIFRTDRTVHDILCIGRLRPGVSIGEAHAELNAIQEHIDELNPTTERGQQTSVYPLKRFMVGDVGGTLLLLQGAVGFVLLIACANVANLSLARSAARAREFAVRRALGASRVQVMQQVITESVVLSLAGGVLGIAIARWGLTAILAASPDTLTRIENVHLDGRVLLFSLGISIAAGILFGLVPALKNSKADPQTGLGGRGPASGHNRTQAVFAVVQIALALVLLSGAGLLFRTINNLQAVNPGFQTQQVITFQVGLSPSIIKTAAGTRAAYQELVQRIEQIPGVEAAGITALLPLGKGDNSGPFWIGLHQPGSMAEIPRAVYYPTGPDYLRAMNIPLLQGRLLTNADSIHSQPVVLIDNILARTYFPNGDAVGHTLTIPHWGVIRALPARIVGVVGHVEQYGLDGSVYEKPAIYYSFYQLPDVLLPGFRGDVTFSVRTPLEPNVVMPAIKKAVYGLANDQPIYNVQTMRSLVSRSMSRQRFPMILLVAFAALALLLASVGIYGVLSYSTARRVPEIGVRMALGAERRDVVQMLVGQGLRLALAGIAIGAVAASILTRTLSSFSHLLYGVRASDPVTFVVVSACLVVAALLACYIPARRAAEVDPSAALRAE